MIETINLNAGYGRAQVLYDFNFSAGENEMVAVVGPNGSGKSTLLKTIMGITRIYSGAVKFEGMDITKLPPHERARHGIAYLPQVGSTFTNLTVWENLFMAGYTIEKEELSERRDMALDVFPVLKGFLNRKAKTLSGGERQMLAMAMALMRKPKVMMFDEPTANLAPNLAVEVLKKIKELSKKLGLTTIIVEQSARMVLEISDKAYLLLSGRPIFEGSARELLEQPKLGKMYLGLDI